jgi:ABC-type nickel/cobalt efflux system permease component RcnA
MLETPRRIRLLFAVALGAVLLGAGSARPAAAHPLGNFTTNQYVRIEVLPETVRLVYILDLAEIPAFQEIGERIDADGDEAVSPAEEAAYLDAKLAEIVPRLHLAVDGADLPLTVAARTLALPEGQAGLKLVRLRAVMTAPLSLGAGQAVAFDLGYETDRPGWREVVVTHAGDVALTASDAPIQDVSGELQRYPDDLLSSPLDRTSARFTAAASPGAAAAVGYGTQESVTGASSQSGRPSGGNSGDRFASLLNGDDLTATGLLVSLCLAFVWGAAHALSPGHGKTVVGAYLVGSRGTPRHALFLGLTVTVTHTAGVIALGLVTLLLSRYILPDQLYPWMSLTSGVLVLGMGLLLLRQRFGHSHGLFGHHHDHEHDNDHDHEHGPGRHHHHHHQHGHGHGHGHSHLPPEGDGDRIRWRSLLALGVSGGLVPCPSALVVLLGAIALGRVGFGLLLVAVFSLGLAGALTGVGILFLYARRFLERRTGDGQPGLIPGLTRLVVRFAPVASALGVTVAGAVIVLRALGETSIT